MYNVWTSPFTPTLESSHSSGICGALVADGRRNYLSKHQCSQRTIRLVISLLTTVWRITERWTIADLDSTIFILPKQKDKYNERSNKGSSVIISKLLRQIYTPQYISDTSAVSIRHSFFMLCTIKKMYMMHVLEFGRHDDRLALHSCQVPPVVPEHNLANDRHSCKPCSAMPSLHIRSPETETPEPEMLYNECDQSTALSWKEEDPPNSTTWGHPAA